MTMQWTGTDRRLPRLARAAAIFLLVAASACDESVTQAVAGDAWSSKTHDVGLSSIPRNWRISSSGESGLVMVKKFTTADGYWQFDERMTLAIGQDNFGSLEKTSAAMNGNGFTLVWQESVRLGSAAVPFWYFHRNAAPDESDWVAVLLQGGRAVVVDLRSTPLDPQARYEFVTLVGSLNIGQDRRERAWSLYSDGKAATAQPLFQALVDIDAYDGNARYGLGLSKLANGQTTRAIEDLNLAARQLGQAEDVRPALGRAEWELGHADRAAALWVQALRANPTLDDQLRPALLRAAGAKAATTSASQARLVVIALDFIKATRSRDSVTLAGLQLAYRDVFDRVETACLASTCRMIAGLLPAHDIEQGMAIVKEGSEANDADRVYAGQQRIFDGLRSMADNTPAMGR